MPQNDHLEKYAGEVVESRDSFEVKNLYNVLSWSL